MHPHHQILTLPTLTRDHNDAPVQGQMTTYIHTYTGSHAQVQKGGSMPNCSTPCPIPCSASQHNTSSLSMLLADTATTLPSTRTAATMMRISLFFFMITSSFFGYKHVFCLSYLLCFSKVLHASSFACIHHRHFAPLELKRLVKAHPVMQFRRRHS